MTILMKARVRTDFGEFGNPIFNIFGYTTGNDAPNPAQELADAMELELFPFINDCQTSNAFITELEVVQVNGAAYELRSYTDEYGGTAGVDQAPPFVAWSFKLLKATAHERSGGKRIGPINQTAFADRVVEPVTLGLLNLLADAMGNPLAAADEFPFLPVILERPETEFDVWSSHPVSSCVFVSVSTQNTRKK